MTKIEWTDESWNPVVGCTKIAPGCKNCYAERMAKRLVCMGIDRYYPVVTGGVYSPYGWNGKVNCVESELNKPLHWRKPRKIFICSMSDLFHEKVPYSFQVKVFQAMECAEQHTFQVLTKRPERMLEFVEKAYKESPEKPYLDNVWLGTSISTQADADRNIPILLQIPAAVRFVSVEPILERVDFSYIDTGKTWPFRSETSKLEPLIGGTYSRRISDPNHGRYMDTSGPRLDWIILGCESGPGARLCSIEDIRDAVRQCKDAGVPVFVKQVPINGKCSKGPKDWPEDLRVQEYPNGITRTV